MKKLIMILLCVLAFAGCNQTTSAPETADTQSILTPAPMNISIYSGNELLDGFKTTIYEVYFYNSATLIEKLIELDVLSNDVELLSEKYDGTCLHLDFNEAFRSLVYSMGTTGEYMIIGSVVNTFLDNYSDLAESIFITVNGEILESGHVIYDFELSYYN